LFHFEVELGELLAEADVVSLHLPLGSERRPGRRRILRLPLLNRVA